MGKTIPPSKFTELKGLDRISSAVHEMKCLWREISKDDYGIDGDIEVVREKADGKGFETTGGVVKVQAKAGASYLAWDNGQTFAVAVRKEDLEYWNGYTYPVLFIYYHPSEDKLYYKEVKSYLQTTANAFSPPYQIRFDKATDEFGPACYSSLCKHANVSPPRVTFQQRERLFSNLLRVKRLPSVIRHAATTYTSHEAVKSEAKGGLPQFCIVDGRLYTLADLRDRQCVLRRFCSPPVRTTKAQRWIEDESRRRDFVFLLNQLLGKHLGRCGLRYNPHFGRNYFPRTNDTDKKFIRRWKNVRTGKDAPPRTVAKYYEYGKSVKFWRHLAAEFEFREIGGEWFLQVEPRYFFTEDGETPCSSELAGPYTTSLKAKEHNLQVLNHVLFWADVLSRSRDSIGLSVDRKVVMRIEKLPVCEIAGFAIADDPATFEEKAPSPQLSLFNWDREHEQSDEDDEYDEY